MGRSRAWNFDGALFDLPGAKKVCYSSAPSQRGSGVNPEVPVVKARSKAGRGTGDWAVMLVFIRGVAGRLAGVVKSSEILLTWFDKLKKLLHNLVSLLHTTRCTAANGKAKRELLFNNETTDKCGRLE